MTVNSIRWCYRIFLWVTVLFASVPAQSQYLIMNEVSNGAVGNQEYVEFLVVSDSVTYDCNSPVPPCIDIRGWIFDDNNGYHGNDGVAGGAVRFSQNPLWSCVPLGTIIVLYNDADRNPAIPADDLSLSDGNCNITAPLNSTLFESNTTTPGAIACSYPATGWTPGGNWNNTVLANTGDCARIVNLAGCEVFSLCYGPDSLNNLIYFPTSGGQRNWYFNGGDPRIQANWSGGSSSPSPGTQTPGLPNNAANAAYIQQFNNSCIPITPIQVTALVSNSGCSCNGTAIARAIGSIGGYTFEWFNGSFQSLGQTDSVATGLCPGLYYVIATSHIGCSDTASVYVSQTGNVTMTATGATACAGSAVTISATASSAGGNYLWSPGGATAASISVNPASTTVYSCTYTLGSCQTTTTATVTINPVPAISVPSSIVCAGVAATLAATVSPAGGTYVWSPGGQTTNSITVSPATTTNYSVTYTLSGCTASATNSVTVNPIPTVSATSTTICSGSNATVTASSSLPGGTYAWSPGGQTTSSITVSPATTTNYTVTYTLNNCSSTSTGRVTVNPLPTVSVAASTICAGSTATMTAVPSLSGGTYAWSPGGQTTNAISVIPANTTIYSVVYTLSGCAASDTSVVTVNPLPVVSVNSPSICRGSVGTLSASGATSYSWSSGNISSSITVSPVSTTNYTVTGTTSGCSSSTISTLTVLPLPVVTVNSDSVCAGGSLNLQATGATSYSWSNGAAGSIITVTPFTTTSYTVVGTTAGCTATAISTVNVVPAPVVAVNSVSICRGSSAVLIATGASDYQWSNGATTPIISVSPANTSTYTVVGSIGTCNSSAIATVTVRPLPIVLVSSAVICAGQSTSLNASGASVYSWSNGSVNNSITVSPAVTTNYTVVGTTNSCSDTALSIVTVNPLPLVSVNSATICPGSTAILSANGATSYQWSNGATQPSISVSPMSTTTYSVVGTTLGCSATTFATVTISTILSVNASADDTICSGSSAVLSVPSASPGSTFSWVPTVGVSNPAAASPLVSPVATTTYTVTVTDPTGCYGSDVVTVCIDPIITASVVVQNVSCAGGQDGAATISAVGGTGPFLYQWSNGCDTARCSGLTPGSYTAIVTDAIGCTTQLSASIVEPTAVVVSLIQADSTNCHLGCDASAEVQVVGGNGVYTFDWNTVPRQSSSLATNLCAGNYRCVTMDRLGCRDSIDITIYEPSPVLLSPINSQTPCSGGSTQLSVTASGGADLFSYQWTPSIGLSSATVQAPIASPVVATTYSVVATDQRGCTSPTSTVLVYPVATAALEVAVIGGGTICPGSSQPLIASATGGNGGPYSYEWSPAPGLSVTNIPNPLVTPDTTTWYIVTVVDGCAAVTTDSVVVDVYPSPVASLSADVFAGCPPVCVNFSSGTAAVSYAWNFGQDEGGDISAAPYHCFNEPGDYTISLSATTAAGCTADTQVVDMIHVYQVPTALFSASPDPATILSSTVSFTDLSTPDVLAWRWEFGDGSISTATSPVHTYSADESGSYLAELVVWNRNGCSDTVQVMVEIGPEFSFFIPNCFTPNGDGVNENFRGHGIGIKEYKLMIFDRWGDLIWQTTTLEQDWDGRANDGTLVSQQDAFDWKVILTDVFDKKHVYFGRVSIVK